MYIDFNKEIELIMSGEKSLSYSGLSKFIESPLHFFRYKTEKKTTKAMEEGKRFHMAVLEPEKFNEKYWFLDDSQKVLEIGGGNPRGTKIYKDWIIEQQSNNSSKEMILKDEYDMYSRMLDSLLSNKATKDLMLNLIEKESFFEYELDGFKLCGVIDGKGSDYIIDLKKVDDASYKKVKWKIFDSNFDLQGGLYSTAKNIKNYYLIFIDSDCNITVVKFSEGTIQSGMTKLENALSKFSECVESDLWQSSYEFYNGGFILV